MNEDSVLTIKERAFILDKISGSSYYREEFGLLLPHEERELIAAISKKLELTYYLSPGPKYFYLKQFSFTKEQALEALEDLENFRKIFEEALKN